MAVSGIYAISNNHTGRTYVGQATNVSARWSAHRRSLRRGVHDNHHLQRSVAKHGLDAFTFILLQTVPDRNHLTAVEESLLSYYRTLPAGVYNQAGPAASPNLGRKFSDLHKARIGQSNKGRTYTTETLARMSAAKKGRTLTAAHREKMAEASLKRLPVERCDPLTDGLLEEFPSTRAVERAGYSRDRLRVALQKGTVYRQAKWRYKKA